MTRQSNRGRDTVRGRAGNPNRARTATGPAVIAAASRMKRRDEAVASSLVALLYVVAQFSTDTSMAELSLDAWNVPYGFSVTVMVALVGSSSFGL